MAQAECLRCSDSSHVTGPPATALPVFRFLPMKLQLALLSLASFTALGSFVPVRAQAADLVRLNDYPSVAIAGRYLYFDHSPGTPFLSRGYYPAESGPAALISGEPGRNPGPATEWITFQSGALTDDNSATHVTGWTGRTRWQAANRNEGPFILFDLGQAYNLARIDIRLQDHSGQRWYGGSDHPQRLWTATTLSGEPGRGIGLDTGASFWNGRYTFTLARPDSTSLNSVEIDASRPTRYVLLLLRAGTVDGSNTGGIIRDVIFHAAHPLQITPTAP
jgi:hypothetical protein